MSEVQKNIDSRLSMITKKMTNIEQKVFATQKNMDSIANAPTTDVNSKSPQKADNKSGQDKETLKMMLESLQKQQEQINQFMKNTQQDLK